MKIFEVGRDPQAEIEAALAPSPSMFSDEVRRVVGEIISDVRQRGDEALLELGRRFDSPDLSALKVSDDEIDSAYREVPGALIEAIRRAKSNIESFHLKQLRQSWFDVTDGCLLGQIYRPIERVGLYAPGGRAPYPSSVLMIAVPAKVAGVKFMVMCSPARPDGRADPLTLVAARESGVDAVFKIGGAQAVAAMAFGTESVPKVDKIVGPGNPYVTEAKRQVYGSVGIDMMAGPSEIMIVADDTADPVMAAADMISQAEHAEDSKSVFVTTSRYVADRVLAEVKRRRDQAARSDVITQSLAQNGVMILAQTIEQAADLVNLFAPEHLELLVADPWSLLPMIKNAGAIMLGHFSPVPFGDYAAGPSHTLPTGGTARFSSPVTVDDFVKKSSLVECSRSALENIADTVIKLAEAEGFMAHADSIRVRFSQNKPADGSE